jgi:hypothetical protein
VFKILAMSSAIAGIMSFSVAESFDTVHATAQEVVGVYDVAQQIDPRKNSLEDYRAHQQALFETTGRLEGIAVRSEKVMNEQNEIIQRYAFELNNGSLNYDIYQ